MGVVHCGDLHDEARFPLKELKRLLGAGADWLYHACRGVDNVPVNSTSSSHLSGNFSGDRLL
jgi:nucleotidyltransferase/DNA polymerase involved in DNA repair